MLKMAIYKQFAYSVVLLLSLIGSSMAARIPNDDVLGWVKKDNRRFLHVDIRVGDLNRTIKFYTESLGMKLLSQKYFPKQKYSKAVVGFGPRDTHFVLEFACINGVEKYEIGTAFGHIGIATQDIYAMVESIRAKGGVITREPGPGTGLSIFYAFGLDPDGYTYELIQRPPTPEPLSHIMLHVADLDRAIKFYGKALGMKLLLKYDSPQEQFTFGMVGYGSNLTQTTTHVELTYNYNVTEYIRGNGYTEVAVGTDNVYKSAAAVKLVAKELGGQIILPPGPIPQINTKITSFVDPDGWKTDLVDNKDYLKELHKKE